MARNADNAAGRVAGVAATVPLRGSAAVSSVDVCVALFADTDASVILVVAKIFY